MNEIVKETFMPAMSIEKAVERYNAVVEFTKRVMKPNKDFGIIPGTDKPTLLKPGAEKLCSLFGFSPEFTMEDEVKDFEKGIFYFRYSCNLLRNGDFVASGEGSANSKEKKYRWRTVFANQATESDKANGRLETRQSRNGKGSYQVYVIENTEPFDLINTLQKMAQKRALIAATLIAANASEFYTQDVEDLEYIEGEIVEHHIPKPSSKPEAAPVAKVSNEVITDGEWDNFMALCEKAKGLHINLPQYDRSKMTASTLNGAKAYINQQISKKEGK